MSRVTNGGWLVCVLTMVAGVLLAATALAKEVEVKLSDCPAAVRKTLEREAQGAKIDKVEKEAEDGETTYEADAKIDGAAYEITVAEDGTLLEKSLDGADDDEEKEADEVEVKLADCPAAVQKTLKREAGEAAVDSAFKENEGKKTCFEFDVKIDGKPYEIKIAEDGKLISKVLDDDE
jgi:hypothetical protein